MLYYIILYYNILYDTILYCTMLYYNILYDTILYCMLYFTVLHYNQMNRGGKIRLYCVKIYIYIYLIMQNITQHGLYHIVEQTMDIWSKPNTELQQACNDETR